MLLKNDISENIKAQDIKKKEKIHKLTMTALLFPLTLPNSILCFICWIEGKLLGEKLTAILEKLTKKDQGNEMLIIFFRFRCFLIFRI